MTHTATLTRAIQPEPLSTQARAYGFMSAGAFAVLRHIEVNGPQTFGDVAKAHHNTQKATVRQLLASLQQLGHLALDSSTKEPTYFLTNRGRAKLADPHDAQAKKATFGQTTVAPIKENARSKNAFMRALQGGLPPVMQRPTYQPTELMPSLRPGSNDAFALPSRIGDVLTYRDGRRTTLNGDLLS